MRRARYLLALVLTAGVAAFFWRERAPKGLVTVDTKLASLGVSSLTLGKPFRAVLALEHPLGADRRLDAEIARIENGSAKTEKMWTVPVKGTSDEVYVTFRDVAHVTDGNAGNYRLAFRLDGNLVGAREFTVVPASDTSAPNHR